MSDWFTVHAHSNFSAKDGMTTPADLVHKAALLGYPALGLTDHGNMGGTVQLYKAARKEGILPLPGFEGYLIEPNAEDWTAGTNDRFHFCILALNYEGYKALVKFNSLSHTRPRFNRFPRHNVADMAAFGREHGKDVLLTTGCYFGLVQQRLAHYGIESAQRIVKFYQKHFPNLVVELQNHGITHDDGGVADDAEMVEELVAIADGMGLPVLITSDSHYTDQRQKKAHALMKKMVYGGAEDAFPGDSFHLPSADWVRAYFPKTIWRKNLETCRWLLEKYALTVPPLEKYTAYLPHVTKKNPDFVLRKLVFEWIEAQNFSTAKKRRYITRAEEELGTIKHVGYANYFLIVRRIIQHCEEQGWCVEARGSANGSLVCHALGITSPDPVEYNLWFERFLSRDRIKPPDIDIDIEAIHQGDLIRWIGTQWPTLRIGSWSKLGESAQNPGRGSVLVSYISYLRRLCEDKAREIIKGRGGKASEVNPYSHAIFTNTYGKIEAIEDIERINYDDYQAIKELAAMGTVYKGQGQHAAGVLLGTDELAIEDVVPRALIASSNMEVSQYDMDDVEEWGLQKLDILGQTTLTVMRRCQEMMGRENPRDFKWIPKDDRDACRLLREGVPDNGIFHFEGYTKAKGGREMGVQSTMDAIIAGALYMPGVDERQKRRYLRSRKEVAYKAKLKMAARDVHQVVHDVLEESNGVMVYQEHPLIILRRLGVSIESVNTMYKILKDSGSGAIERNRDRLASIREEFDRVCEDQGVTEPDGLWEAILGFQSYGFNKSHATGYGIRSYRCAYLKAHYPLEFMTALLEAWSKDSDKEAAYVREARRIKLRMLPPHVNRSNVSWSLDRESKGIRKGLMSIKGIGPAAAQEIVALAPFESLTDLATRCSGRAVSGGKDYLKTGVIGGKMKELQNAGALDGLRR